LSRISSLREVETGRTPPLRSYLRFSERSNRDEFTDGAFRKPQGWIERIEIMSLRGSKQNCGYRAERATVELAAGCRWQPRGSPPGASARPGEIFVFGFRRAACCWRGSNFPSGYLRTDSSRLLREDLKTGCGWDPGRVAAAAQRISRNCHRNSALSTAPTRGPTPLSRHEFEGSDTSRESAHRSRKQPRRGTGYARGLLASSAADGALP
jgi:hypothetical protein